MEHQVGHLRGNEKRMKHRIERLSEFLENAENLVNLVQQDNI